MDEYVKAVVNADTSREALIGKLANVLCNASNYPPRVASRILGQNMMPLMSMVADVVIARDRAVAANAWDERDKAEPTYDGPDSGHYEDCMGYEDCHCATYPNPYRITEED